MARSDRGRRLFAARSDVLASLALVVRRTALEFTLRAAEGGVSKGGLLTMRASRNAA
jgi:hypothetical protein